MKNSIYLCALLIAQSSDCHPNPGPNKTNTNTEYPCFVCGNEVLDNEAGIQYDCCDCWYHTTCINMNNETYSLLSKTNISWICAKCSSVNTTTSSILEKSIINQPSYYGVLSDEDPSLSGTPISTSTPTKSKRNNLNTNTNHTTRKPVNELKLLIMNTQSLKRKKESVWNVIDDESPYIIAFSDTWLNNNIHNSEKMPPIYE